MKFTITDTKKLLQHTKVLIEYVQEAVFKVEKQSLSCLALSTDTTCLYAFEVPIVGNVGNGTSFALLLDNFLKALNKCKGETTFELDDRFTIKNKNLQYVLTLVDETNIKVPENKILPGNTQVRLSTKEFKRLLDEATIFTTIVEFTKNGTAFSVSGKNDMLSDTTVTTIEVGGDGDGTAKYEYSLFKAVVSLEKLFEEVVVSFQNEYPLVLQWADDDSSASLVVAPRVNNV